VTPDLMQNFKVKGQTSRSEVSANSLLRVPTFWLKGS